MHDLRICEPIFIENLSTWYNVHDGGGRTKMIGRLFKFLLYLDNYYQFVYYPTDASVISSSVPSATTNTPPGNHFEWADYSVYFCEENDSTFYLDRQYSADTCPCCCWCSCRPIGDHSATTINSTLLQKEISVSTSNLHDICMFTALWVFIGL